MENKSVAIVCYENDDYQKKFNQFQCIDINPKFKSKLIFDLRNHEIDNVNGINFINKFDEIHFLRSENLLFCNFNRKKCQNDILRTPIENFKKFLKEGGLIYIRNFLNRDSFVQDMNNFGLELVKIQNLKTIGPKTPEFYIFKKA